MTGQSESESDSIEVKECEKSINKYEVKNNLYHVCHYDNCNAVFKRLYRLNRHLRRHTGQRPFICPLEGCERSFTCKTYLNKHVKRPHNIDSNGKTKVEQKIRKEYICDECQKVFKTKFQLRIHSYQHNGQKPFECNKCDKQFATQSKLKSHLKTHEGYSCGRDGCNFVATKWTELRKHIAFNHKCLKCDVCDKKFNNSYNLNLHKETIHSKVSEQFLCSFEGCDRTYTRKSSLMSHIRSSHNGTQYKCTQEGCDLTFKHKKSLNRHLENHSKPKPEKARNKIIRRRVCKASQLTDVEVTKDQMENIMNCDIQFRTQCVDSQIK